MSLRRSFLRGGATLAAGQAAGQGLSFVRNVVVARLVAPEDFGIAATFAITVSMLEMLSDLAADRLVIQDRDGYKDEFLATVHSWQLGRGLVAAILLLALAWPLAQLFDVPQAFWAFCLLPIVPLSRGLLHLDIRRQQRGMRFWPWVGTEVGSQALATAAAFPLAWWLHDYSAMLWVLLIRALSQAAISHLLAPSRFRLAWNRAVVGRLVAFGWPLLLNGMLMFAILQGDRALVGATYSMEDLGFYSVAFVLASAPSMLAGNVASSLFLPILSQSQDDRAAFAGRYRLCCETLSALALVCGGLLVLLGPWLLPLLYGNAYAAAVPVFAWLALAHAFRLARQAPTLAAMARADSRVPLLANVFRVSGFGAALVVAALGQPLPWIAGAAVMGELIALVAVAALVAKHHGLGLLTGMRPLLASIALLGAVVSVAALRESDAAGWTVAVAGLGVGTLLVAGLTALFPLLRDEACRGICWWRMRRAQV